MTYKPHIDGLRAFAVLAVVLFHYKVPGVRGGFVGVDVFFVISGYLITSLITQDLEEGAFTLRGFYARRARRILPASFAVIAAVAVFGLSALPSTDLLVLGKSILATVFFVSNFFFREQADYFGADSGTLHLLHTWSLAIEEQFYFLFPLLLRTLGATATGKRRRLAVLSILAALSFALSVWETPRDAAFAFYMLPTRAFELLAGALVAVRPPDLARSPRLASVLTLAGLAAILGSSVVFDGETPFPGVAAALPTLGAALLVAAGGHAERWARFPLENRLAVGIGKISYSVYLWHWPVVVAYFGTFHGPAAGAPLLFLPLFPVSYLSYRFVEQPFRRQGFLGAKPRVALAFGTAALLAGFGLLDVKTHGLLIGLDARAAAIAEAPKKRSPATTGGECFSNLPFKKFATTRCLASTPGKRTVLLWGDSVAAHYSLGLRAAARNQRIDILQVTMAGCSPSLGWNPRNRPGCKDRNDAVLDWAKAHRPALVLLAGEWTWEDKPELYRTMAGKTLAALDEAGLRTLILGPPIQYKRPLPELLVKSLREGRPFHSADHLNTVTEKVDTDMRHGSVDLRGAKFVSAFELLCNGWDCPGFTPDGAPLLWDTHHFTYEGSLFFGEKLMPLVENELDRGPIRK